MHTKQQRRKENTTCLKHETMLDKSLMYVQWWEESSCTENPLVDEKWKGTLGVGIGENGILDHDEDHKYSNMYV